MKPIINEIETKFLNEQVEFFLKIEQARSTFKEVVYKFLAAQLNDQFSANIIVGQIDKKKWSTQDHRREYASFAPALDLPCKYICFGLSYEEGYREGKPYVWIGIAFRDKRSRNLFIDFIDPKSPTKDVLYNEDAGTLDQESFLCSAYMNENVHIGTSLDELKIHFKKLGEQVKEDLKNFNKQKK